MSDKKITILGAGPAGLSAAIFLGMNNVPVTLIDKDCFPRDKVCGDCLGGYAISVINQISPSFLNQFVNYDKTTMGYGVKFFGPAHQEVSIPATNLVNEQVQEVALCKRIDFDRFLLDEAKKYRSVRFLEQVYIKKITRKNGKLLLIDKDKKIVERTDLLILATGSNMFLTRQLTGNKYNKKDFAAGIRTYFKDISGLGDKPYIELHFLKELAPGYLWIFPLQNNLANVGLGLRSDVVSRKKFDLKGYFENIITKDAYFKERFANASRAGEIQGFPLAINNKWRSLSGNNYLIAGDAGNLIEPLFGEGIGHAMYSGKFAADQAVQALKMNNFSDVFLAAYDQMVFTKLENTFKFSRLMQKIAFYPGLMNYLFNRMGNNPVLQKQMFGIINGQISKTPLNGLKFMVRLITGL